MNCEKCKRLLTIIENLVGSGPMTLDELRAMEILLKSADSPVIHKDHALAAVHVLMEEKGFYVQ